MDVQNAKFLCLSTKAWLYFATFIWMNLIHTAETSAFLHSGPVFLYSCIVSTREIHKILLVSMAVRENIRNLYHEVLNILLLLHLPKGEYSMYQCAPYINIFKFPPGVKYLVTHLLFLLFLAHFFHKKEGKKQACEIAILYVFTFQIRHHFNDFHEPRQGRRAGRGHPITAHT
jgi:hypothetical protein